MARCVSTLQLVECGLVYLSGNERQICKWMLVWSKGEKILLTGGGGYFGHKLGNELKKMGAVVVLCNISWPLDDVGVFLGRLDR